MDTITVSGIDELIPLVPHQIGHHPSNALVVTGLHGKGLVVTAHLPLGPAYDPDLDLSPLVADLVRGLWGNGVDGYVVIAFEDEEGTSDRALQLLHREGRHFGLIEHEVAVVRDGRRWLPQSSDHRDRVLGAPIAMPDQCPAVVELMMRGSAPVKDRAALRELVTMDPLPAAAVREELVNLDASGVAAGRAGKVWRAFLRRRLGDPVRAASRSLEAAGAGTSPRDVARLLRSLDDIHWRDAVIAWAAPGSLPIEKLPARAAAAARRWLPAHTDLTRPALEHLTFLARCAPDADASATAAINAVVGCVAWHRGEGSLARDALERALAADPDYRLAQLGMRLVLLNRNPHRREGGAHRQGRSGSPQDGPDMDAYGERAV